MLLYKALVNDHRVTSYKNGLKCLSSQLSYYVSFRVFSCTHSLNVQKE